MVGVRNICGMVFEHAEFSKSEASIYWEGSKSYSKAQRFAALTLGLPRVYKKLKTRGLFGFAFLV